MQDFFFKFLFIGIAIWKETRKETAAPVVATPAAPCPEKNSRQKAKEPKTPRQEAKQPKSMTVIRGRRQNHCKTTNKNIEIIPR